MILLTAVFDGYDTLKPLPSLEPGCTAVCVTDGTAEPAAGWELVVVEPTSAPPNLQAKRPKCLPWEYVDDDLVVWIDASFQVWRGDVASHYLGWLDDEHALAQYAHPLRDCIFDEAEASKGIPKYDGLPIDEQLRTYRSLGHPERWGLWATGVIARRRTFEIELLGRRWLDECEQHTFQDQLSQPFVLRQLGLRPRTIDGHVALPEPFMTYVGSPRHHTG